MAKILGFVGSHRKMGNSDVLIKEAIDVVQQDGADTELIYLTDLNVKVCKGCLACVFKGKCSIQDDVPQLIEKCLEADGIFMAAPTYLFSPSGIIKTLIDRTLILSSNFEELNRKQRWAMTISVAGNNDWNPMGIEFLNQFVLSFGFLPFDYIEAYAPGPAEILLDKDLIIRVQHAAKNMHSYLLGKDFSPRKPEARQCPVCFSRFFRWKSEKEVLCPICLTKGEIKSDGTIYFSEKAISKHFWTPEHRKQHLEEWILKTRDGFLENRKKVKPLLEKYRHK